MSSQSLSADIQLIQRILPHRYPFLLVDKVVDINGTQSAKGLKNVTMNEPHFQGHFPSNPIMPGVTIVEAMAQTAAVMVGTALDLADKDLLIYFMAIDKCNSAAKSFRGMFWKCSLPPCAASRAERSGSLAVSPVSRVKWPQKPSLLL